MPYPFSPPQINYGMANQANTFMQQQARLPYQFNLPNYGGMLGQRSKNIGGLLKGEVPTDVLQQIQQSGAERGVATGMPGSPNANASWLRALVAEHSLQVSDLIWSLFLFKCGII